ncbi:MAG TPA: adenylate/guanylate cyclase domain-containing protein [Gaiellaceae bacterium]|nr:adenylate/guanylate cyclase domain-containing protein [Gaiellaceae bacterium]
MASVSAEELSGLVPCPLDQVRRLERLGLLASGEDGRFPLAAVHVVRLMEAFEEAGISVDDVARGVAAGELSFPLGLFLPEPVGTPETYEALAERLGRPPDLLRRLSGELGLPPAVDDRLREEDAEMLSLLVARLDLATEDELSRFARLYGGSVQRLVSSGLQFFDQAVRQRVAGYELPNEEKDRLVYERAAGFTELVSRLVPWLQRRHREHSVLDYIVGVTEGFMEERGITPRQPRQPPAIAFLDLAGYSTLAEERGDEAAAELAAGLASVVQEAARTQGCRPVKWLGDGVMFHFADSGRAIESALDLVEKTEQAISVPARIGINAGAVVAQEGDYFGRTVNIAARIADYARPREVLVSEDAKRSAVVEAVEFELIGDVPLKGVSTSVRLHKASRAEG